MLLRTANAVPNVRNAGNVRTSVNLRLCVIECELEANGKKRDAFLFTMSVVLIHPSSSRSASRHVNPLPKLLQTPSGLAILEMQGTINLPARVTETAYGDSTQISKEIPIGRLVFPDYKPETSEADSMAWMKRVYMYVGEHQRMTGEVKKLAKPLAVVKRRQQDHHEGVDELDEEGATTLEIVQIIKWKILFSQRPEPVGTSTDDA